jgi:NADH:ubiquinone reductase (non-electrogenic)
MQHDCWNIGIQVNRHYFAKSDHINFFTLDLLLFLFILHFRSIIEPIRNTRFRQGDHFHLAFATGVDLEKQLVFCESALKQDIKYSLEYDHLVIGVGALSNTFGVPGVVEHACFLKEVADARRIRNQLLSNFELAIQRHLPEEESKRLLHTVIVGGGPTGVEFGAELYDFVEQVRFCLFFLLHFYNLYLHQDVSRLYGQDEQKKSRVTLIESNKILSSFDSRLQKYAEKKISQRERFSLLKSSVTGGLLEKEWFSSLNSIVF